jgi:peptidoglycan/xylan/chitin deacetylase (PgdA/CDA1 family)
VAQRLALTFDDGPIVTSLTNVLDILAYHNIKATFFLNAKQGFWGEDIYSTNMKVRANGFTTVD